MTTTARTKAVRSVPAARVLQGDIVLDDDLNDRYTVARITHYAREGIIALTDTRRVDHHIGAGCPLWVLR
jgi:hypothetical protein